MCYDLYFCFENVSHEDVAMDSNEKDSFAQVPSTEVLGYCCKQGYICTRNVIFRVQTPIQIEHFVFLKVN